MKKTLSDVTTGFTKNIALKDVVNNNGVYPVLCAV